jgi:hypothetical protein
VSTASNEAGASSNRKWDAGVRARDAVDDIFSTCPTRVADGIVKQFPDEVAT